MSELIELGYDETLRYIHDFMVNNPPFDVGFRSPGNGVLAPGTRHPASEEKSSALTKQGIMGFSQGGCMAAILAALVSVECVGGYHNPVLLWMVDCEPPSASASAADAA